jgi:hypothetical protein
MLFRNVCDNIPNYRVSNPEHLNPSNRSGCFMYHKVYNSPIRRSAHTLHLCVLYGYQEEQRLFPYISLTD